MAVRERTEKGKRIWPDLTRALRIALGPVPGPNKQQYAVSSDGHRFLVNLAVEEGVTSPITLILNWRPERGK